MPINWEETELNEQIAHYKFPTFADVDAQFSRHQTKDSTAVRINISIEGLEDYVQSWGTKSGVWLVLAVAKMLQDIVDDYSLVDDILPLIGYSSPDRFRLLVIDDHEQEIAHRVMTAYHDIYAVMVRVHGQAKTRIWNRREAVQFFPQLSIEQPDTVSQDAEVDESGEAK
jgi:hypothetical protein